MLGLGLGLSKGKNLLSNLKLLTRNSDRAIWGDKATGISKGTNSPQVNLIQDLVGVVGKNLFDGFVESGSLSGGNPTVSGTYVRSINFTEVNSSTSYIIRKTPMNSTYVSFYTSTKTFISESPNQVGTFFTTPSNCKYIKFISIGAITDLFQLELGTVATTYEPYGKANGLLQGFAFTTASGYVDVVAPNGKTVTGIQCDGVNDVILLPSNAPNPTTGNFAFGLIVKTDANKVKYLLTRNATSDATTQYAFKFDASGNLFVILEGVAIQIGTTLSVGFHSIWLERDSGTLKAFIDGVETYSGAHATTLTSRANTVMMASTTGTGTYTGFSNDLLLASKYCDSNIATNRADWFKFDTKVYGL